MPKGKKKDKKDRAQRAGGQAEGQNPVQVHPSDEDLTDDTASVMSTQSDGSLALGFEVPENGGDEVDESTAQENFEDKVKDVIDGLTQKSAKGRVDCLRSLRAALAKKYMFEFVLNRKLTISDALEKCLKKGKGSEQSLAATCCTLLMLQLGAGVDSEELYKSIQNILTVIMCDNSASLEARSACAESLAMCTFIAASEVEHITNMMSTLESVFKGSFLKGDGAAPTHSPQVAALHSSALNGWSLLMSIAPTFVVKNFLSTHLPILPQLLQSPDVDLRIASGEVIALLYELAREEDEEFWGSDELIVTLKLLATDSNKYRAKKDRRQQRSSFRDILRAIDEGEVMEYQVKFGIESIYIDSWAKKRQYDVLCKVLCSGMNTHLQENEFVREIFGLGSPIPVGAVNTHKASKVERHLFNAASFKARTKARSKFRDKRSAMMTGLTGIPVKENPIKLLKVFYDKILRVIEKMPQDAAYRKHTHNIVQERLAVVNSTKDVSEIEKRINQGQVEELIMQAEKELNLARKMRVWKPWEPLVEEAPKNQWKWPI